MFRLYSRTTLAPFLLVFRTIRESLFSTLCVVGVMHGVPVRDDDHDDDGVIRNRIESEERLCVCDDGYLKNHCV